VGEGKNNSEAVERVTIAEAATLLGCDPETVRNRINDGMYRAEEVVTENGPTWMIDRGSLTTNTPTTASQQGVSGMPVGLQEAIQELARAIRESGIAQDSEQEARIEAARIEATKLAAESAKTNVLLSTGALVGIGTLVGVLPSSDHTRWLVIAILLVSASVLVGFRRMEDLAETVSARRAPKLGSFGVLGPSILVAGLFSFAYYIVYNIDWQREGRLLDLTRDQFVYGTLISAILITALIVGGHALYKRLRRRREDAAG
jgi:hypothetical protein